MGQMPEGSGPAQLIFRLQGAICTTFWAARRAGRYLAGVRLALVPVNLEVCLPSIVSGKEGKVARSDATFRKILQGNSPCCHQRRTIPLLRIAIGRNRRRFACWRPREPRRTKCVCYFSHEGKVGPASRGGHDPAPAGARKGGNGFAQTQPVCIARLLQINK